MAIKAELKNALAEDVKKGLIRLKDGVAPHSSYYNTVLTLWSQWQAADGRELDGIVDYENAQRESNQILARALRCVDALSEDDLVTPSTVQAGDAAFFAGGLAPDDRNFSWADHPILWQETFNTDRGRNHIFRAYKEETWSAAFQRGCFTLTNPLDPDAIRYHHLNIDDRDMLPIPCSVEVMIEESATDFTARAGLQLAFSDDKKTYYVFMLNNAREYEIWHRSEQGFGPLFAGRSAAIQPGYFNRLGVVFSEGMMHFYINDTFVRRLADPFRSVGDTGVIALGRGRFYFDNLTFYRR